MFLSGLTLGALSAPLAGEAQQTGKIYRIGFLAPASATQMAPYVEAFRQGLHEMGDVEGQNIAIELRYTDEHLDRLPDLAAVWLEGGST